MESRVISTFDEFLRLKPAWGELHRSANGSLFQLHDWLELWWKKYGTGRSLSIQTFWNDALLVGIIPGFTETIRLGPISLRRMTMLGEDEAYGEYYPLVDKQCTETVAQSAAAHWVQELKRGTVDVLDFHGFPPGSEFMEAFATGLRAGARVRYIRNNLPHTLVEGATSGETYLKLLSKRRRRSLQRDARALKEVGAHVEVAREWDGGKPFDELVRLHTIRWARDGQPGRFGNPRFTEFVRGVTERLMAQGCARIYFMRFRDERLAALLAFDVNRRNCQYVVGRDPDHELMRYSVGEVLAMRAFMDAFDEGAVLSDLLGGDYQYKHYKGMTKSWYARATVIPSGLRGAKGSLYWGALAMRDSVDRGKRIFVRSKFDNRREPEEQ